VRSAGQGGFQLSVDVGVDVGLLKSEIKKTYASVSQEPEKDFIFPTGRAWAEDLGYPDERRRYRSTSLTRSQVLQTLGRSDASSPESTCSMSAPALARTR
jgi:hypothetical protein